MKRCLVVRHGALGDGIMASCVLPYIKKDGYHIVFHGNSRAEEVLRYNPYIDEWWMYEDDSIPIEKLGSYYKKISKDFDKVVILTGAVENGFLVGFGMSEYKEPIEERRKRLKGKNYYDVHVEKAGYKPHKPKGEIYFSKEETMRGKEWRRKNKNFFKIVWALSGSSVHKVYRFFEPAARAFLNKHENAKIFTVGDHTTKLLTFKHERVVNTMLEPLELSFRDGMLITKYADLVIGPETGILNTAGCFKVPKICLLSHSDSTALTKYWENDYSIQAPCDCSPCFYLHRYKEIWKDVCQLSDLGWPKCTEHDPQIVLEKMEEVYDRF